MALFLIAAIIAVPSVSIPADESGTLTLRGTVPESPNVSAQRDSGGVFLLLADRQPTDLTLSTEGPVRLEPLTLAATREARVRTVRVDETGPAVVCRVVTDVECGEDPMVLTVWAP